MILAALLIGACILVSVAILIACAVLAVIEFAEYLQRRARRISYARLNEFRRTPDLRQR
jgi:hypothetical protein